MNTQERHNEEIPQPDNLFSPLSDNRVMDIGNSEKDSSETGTEPEINQEENGTETKEVSETELTNKQIESLNLSIATMNDAIKIINDAITKENDELETVIDEYARGFNEASLLAEYDPERLEAIHDTLGSNEYNGGFKAAKEYHAQKKEQEQGNILKELEGLRKRGREIDIDLEK